MRLGLLFLFLLTTVGYSQRYMKLGLSIAETTRTPPDGAVGRSTAGLVFGVAFNRTWTERTAFRPELLFIQKGDRMTSFTEELKVRTNYIEVPALLILSLMKEPHPVMLALEFGPSVAYGLGGKYELKSNVTPQKGAVKFGSAPPNTFTQDIYLENPIDINLHFGASITVRERLLFDIRYAVGVTSIDAPPNPLPAGASADDYKIMNRVLQISGGFAFGR